MTDGPCPFCAVARNEEPGEREVFRNDKVVAFFPPEPATLGHTLLIPRPHVPDIWALTPQLAEFLARTTLILAAAIRKAVEPEGLNIIQSNGEAATQTVRHLHVHLVPRWHDDALGRIWPPETNYSERQKDEALASVRLALRAELDPK